MYFYSMTHISPMTFLHGVLILVICDIVAASFATLQILKIRNLTKSRKRIYLGGAYKSAPIAAWGCDVLIEKIYYIKCKS